jgi:type 1 glutamine amidotransferase
MKIACLLPMLFAAMVSFATAAEPLKVLIISGGCCHDYDRQGQILARGIQERCHARCTVLQEINSGTFGKIPLYENPNWADGFDVIIHDECFADVGEVEWIENIVKPHREGKPAVVLHCTMHSYRKAPTDEWRKFVGITSPGHGAHYPFEVKNKAPDHPIMRNFGEKWQTPKEELYYCDKVWDTATPLAEADSKDRKAPQTCVWVNQYGKGKVFGTTVGHYNETVSSNEYLNLLTNGLLWTCDKLTDEGKPAEGYGPGGK